MLPGCHPTAVAVTWATGPAAAPSNGSLVEIDFAATVFAEDPDSRREAANAVNDSGANDGISLLPPPAANHDSRLEPTPATEVDAAAVRTPALAESAAATGLTATNGAAVAAEPLVDASAVTASEGVEAITLRGVETSVATAVTEPALPTDDVTTADMPLLRRPLTAAEDDAALRGAVSAPTEPNELAAPTRPERRGPVTLVDEADAPTEP